MSTRWDKVYKDFKGTRFSVWRESATPFFADKIQFLQDNNVKKILDAGCGDGRNLSAFARAGFEMVGMDSSQEACNLAERVAEKYPQTKVLHQDLKNLNSQNEFDTILCDYVTVHLENIEKVIQNFFSALKKDGYLLIEFLSTDDPSYGDGQKIGKNTFVNCGIFHTFYTLNEAKKLLSSFKILEFQKIKHEDPDHVEDYPRNKRHQHDSIYVLCQKQ
jgi:2-polyprenyl-3-methyl-5-hydroxy-6-metoxy-1,4-benzoquinol methylase